MFTATPEAGMSSKSLWFPFPYFNCWWNICLKLQMFICNFFLNALLWLSIVCIYSLFAFVTCLHLKFVCIYNLCCVRRQLNGAGSRVIWLSGLHWLPGAASFKDKYKDISHKYKDRYHKYKHIYHKYKYDHANQSSYTNAKFHTEDSTGWQVMLFNYHKSKDLGQISQIQRQTDKYNSNYTYRQIQIQNSWEKKNSFSISCPARWWLIL